MFAPAHPNAPISRLMLRHLGLKGDFADQVQQARRIMPQPIWQEARFLMELEDFDGNPRISRQIDPRRVAKARARVLDWLEGPGPAQARWTRLRSVALSVLLGLAVLLGLWALIGQV